MAARKHKRRKNPVQSGLLIVPVFVLAITAWPAKASSNLLENSPFLLPDAAVRAAQQAAPLELRSIMMEGGQYEFSFYDSIKKQSFWTRLHEAGYDFLVKSFDAAHDTVTVEERGRTYVLVLKEAKIAPLSHALNVPPLVSGASQPSVVAQEMKSAPLTLKDLAQHRNELTRELATVQAAMAQVHRPKSPPPAANPPARPTQAEQR